MNIIRPFRGCFYNLSYLKNLKNLICPPYDVIKEEEKKTLKKASSYNFCHLLFKEDKGGYREIKEKFRRWIEDKIFCQDSQDFFYLYQQEFLLKKRKLSRTGFFALLNLERKKAIFPHESTLKAPKEDRFQLLQEVKANLDPIFLVIEKKIKVLEEIEIIYKREKPFINFQDKDGIYHRLWRIKEKRLQNKLAMEMESQRLYIADGHHRFSVAVKFHNLYKKNREARFLLCYFAPPQEGLIILPTHRIVKIKDSFSQLEKVVFPFFDVKRVSRKKLEEKVSSSERFCVGMYIKKEVFLLKLKDITYLDKIFKRLRRNEIYKKVDTYLLDVLILKKMRVEKIDYVHRIEEVEKEIKKDNKKIGFILRSPSLEMVFSLAKKGLLFPKKSTYFYPKLPSGLILRKFNNSYYENI